MLGSSSSMISMARTFGAPLTVPAGSVARKTSMAPLPSTSSPEVLVRLEDGVVTVRPIAGTRPRGKTPEEDRALAAELAADEKELAEHEDLECHNTARALLAAIPAARRMTSARRARTGGPVAPSG